MYFCSVISRGRAFRTCLAPPRSIEVPAGRGAPSTGPSRDGIPDHAIDWKAVLNGKLHPLPRSLFGKIDSSKEQPGRQVADLVSRRLLRKRVQRSFGRGGTIGVAQAYRTSSCTSSAV